MGLLQRIFGERRSPLDNPSMSLMNPAIWNWITGGEPTAAGELISETSALQIVTVYACVRVLAESVASLPLKLYQRLANGRQEATDADLYDLLTLAPNPEMTAFSFFETLVGSLALCGNAFAQIQRSGSTVLGLWPLHPLKTTAVRIGGKLMYRTSDGEANGASRLIAPEDILAIPLFSFDGVAGLSPIALARQDLGLSKAATKFGARFFSSGGRPGGLLSTASNLDVKQRDDVKSVWQSNNGGENQGKTAVLWGDWKYSQIGISPEDSQFLTTRQFQRTEIAAMFRVPSHMVGDNTRLSNSNHEQQSLSFVVDSLRPYLCRIEQEVHRKLMPSNGRNAGRYFVSFDVRDRLRGDFTTTMAGFATGKQWGFYCTNTILEDLGENPIGPKGDDYWMPVNMQVIGAPPVADPTTPTPAERSVLGAHTSALIGLFRDSLGRLLAREKRDTAAIESIFKPLVGSILTLSSGLQEVDQPTSERLTREALKAIEKRSSEWTKEKADELVGPEFVRLVRGIVANVGRELGAQTALQQLEGKTIEQ